MNQLTATSQTRRQESRRIEDCRGDFGQLSGLIERSWSENSQRALFYPADFIASCFEYPGASLSLAPAIYEGAAPLAFGAAFPRRVSLLGQKLNLVIITFLTVASENKKRGYGVVLWNELVKRARAAGFDGMVNYCAEGEAMNSMILGCSRLLNLSTTRVYSIPYWSRILPPRKVQEGHGAPAQRLAERFLGLTAPLVAETPLSRVWSIEEADWQCRRRFGCVVTEVEAGPRRGMLVGYILPVANASRTQCLMVEDVLWGDLEPPERERLVQTFLHQAGAAGAQLAVLPVLGYADLAPFHAARFRPSNRVLHTYLTLWNGAPSSEALPSMYLDVV